MYRTSDLKTMCCGWPIKELSEHYDSIGFEVLTAVTVKGSGSCDMTP
jgi:hypothetical protein